MALIYTEFEVDSVSFHIFTLPDRRPTAGSSRPVKWLYQMDVESFLYNHGDDSRSTGAPCCIVVVVQKGFNVHLVEPLDGL